MLGNDVSTTWNTANARVILKDSDGEIDVKSENGKRTLVAKNAKGERVFDGPIDTDEQRAKVPEPFRSKLEQIDTRTRIELERKQPADPVQGAANPPRAEPFELSLTPPAEPEDDVQ